MRRLIALLAAIVLIAVACTGRDRGGTTAVPVTEAASGTTPQAPGTTFPSGLSSTTTTITAATTTTLTQAVLAGELLDPELFCRDIAQLGGTYADAVAYWAIEGRADRMDADHNGIPCETVYAIADVDAFYHPAGIDMPGDLSCGDLQADGLPLSYAVAYWVLEGAPARMDADGDGLPCETVYGTEAFEAFFPRVSRSPYSVAAHGLYPDPLPDSDAWLGSGCSPGVTALPDGIWWGYTKDLSPASVTFDLACIRWVEDPDDDPIEEGGWVVENNNVELRVVPVHPQAQVTCPYWGCPPDSFPYAEWIEDSTLPHGEAGVWLYINAGVVTEVGLPVLAG